MQNFGANLARGSRPFNLNFLVAVLDTQNAKMSIFENFLKMDGPRRGGFGATWAPWGPMGGILRPLLNPETWKT